MKEKERSEKRKRKREREKKKIFDTSKKSGRKRGLHERK